MRYTCSGQADLSCLLIASCSPWIRLLRPGLSGAQEADIICSSLAPITGCMWLTAQKPGTVAPLSVLHTSGTTHIHTVNDRVRSRKAEHLGLWARCRASLLAEHMAPGLIIHLYRSAGGLAG